MGQHFCDGRKEVTPQPCTIIAECGNNHEGKMDAALELLERAKESGADLVKFQAGVAAGFARTPEDVPRYVKYELGEENYWRLVARGQELGVPVFFSVWSDGSAEAERWLSPLRRLPYFKIAARQSNDQRLIDEYDQPSTFVSIPHTRVVAPTIRRAVPMHCVSEYPATGAMYGRFELLRHKFKQGIGYSDHTVGIVACSNMAKHMGAVAIEKHFTLAHDFGELRDHALSATPGELRELVERIKT